MNREAIQAALFAHLTGNETGLSDLKIASRRLKSPQDVGAGNCPALFQIYKGETVEWSGMQPLKRTMHLDLVLYVHSGDKSFPTSSLLNPMVGLLKHPPPARGGATEPLYPVAPPTLTLQEIRAFAGSVLPGARVRRRLFFRYTLEWAAP